MRDKSMLIEIIGLFVSTLLGIALFAANAGVGPSVAYPIILQAVFAFVSMRLQLADISKTLSFGTSLSHVLPIYQRLNEMNVDRDKLGRALTQYMNNRFLQTADDLGFSRVTLTPKEFMEFADYLFPLLGRGDEFFAASLLGGGNYWAQKYAERYLTLNRDAVERGCRMRRVFIMAGDDTDPTTLERARRQSSMVEVLAANITDVTARDSSAARDFFLINGSLAAEWRFDNKFAELESITLVFSKGELRRFGKYAECILSEAKTLDAV